VPEWIVTVEEAGLRLDKFLAAPSRAGSRGRATDAIGRGRVFVNGEEAAGDAGAQPLQAGDRVRLWTDRPGSAGRRRTHASRLGLSILFEDDDLIVVDKPAGLLTVPPDDEPGAPSVLGLLASRFRSHAGRTPLVVHRIDRDTSGIVLFALNPRARSALVSQFARREPERVYLAVVQGRLEAPSGIWRDRLVWNQEACLQRPARQGDLDIKDAESEYRVLDSFGSCSLLEVRLHTGRQGQIRVQTQLRGHALVGDRRYADRPEASSPARFPRQALHASRLAFAHPRDGRRVEVMAPVPADLRRLLDRLRRGG
jgi:23S rRNA pseudouridine1911/1915/1917 synthase